MMDKGINKDLLEKIVNLLEMRKKENRETVLNIIRFITLRLYWIKYLNQMIAGYQSAHSIIIV